MKSYVPPGVILALLAAGITAHAAPTIEGVLRVDPVGDYSCIAAEIAIAPGQALQAVQWLHNDGRESFPEVLLLEGTPGQPPDLAETGMVLTGLSAGSFDWGRTELPVPVTSSTGIIQVVFVLPPGAEVSGTGEGGGPGIGLTREGPPIHISAEGTGWVRFDRRYGLAVIPEWGSGKTTGEPLASLKGHLPEGWAPPEATAAELPTTVHLYAPVPNPFNPLTTIRFDLPRPSRVDLSIYDLRGRRVRTLVAGELPAGTHSVEWRGLDHRDRPVASGAYFVRMTGAGVTRSQRVVLLK